MLSLGSVPAAGAAMVRAERYHRQDSRTLDSGRQTALMLRAYASLASSLYLIPVRQISSEHVYSLVVNVLDVVNAE